MSDLDDKLMDPTRSLQRVQVKACQCVVCEKEDGNLMCGQCYYDRFEKELTNPDKVSRSIYADGRITEEYSYTKKVALQAARKAAGLK